ncbi:MAG: hypothetical protein DRN30_05240 [Thermoplasmata archaeon]|nr:MAG: hypothetical protein DRN30_05240 [Thermoplasmata archaeon]
MKLIGILANPQIPVYAQIDLKYATLRLKDGASAEIIIKVGEGNLSYTERRNIEYTLDRGVLDEVREGDEVPVEVSMDLVWEWVTGGSESGDVGTVEDFLKKKGQYSGNTSTDSDACRPYAVDIEVEYVPDCSVEDKEYITLSDYRYEELAHDLRAGTIATSGQCNITEATAVRLPQST